MPFNVTTPALWHGEWRERESRESELAKVTNVTLLLRAVAFVTLFTSLLGRVKKEAR